MAGKEQEERKKLYIGIDPGLTGAVALIDESGKCLLLSDCPTEKKSEKKAASPKGIASLIADIKRKYKGGFHALLEEPVAMPNSGRSMGVTSMLSYGRGVGIWEGALAMAGVKFDRVYPNIWKRELFNGNKGDKSNSIELARRLFPSARRKLSKIKYHGRAEALLIAYFLSAIFRGEKKIESEKVFRTIRKSGKRK